MPLQLKPFWRSIGSAAKLRQAEEILMPPLTRAGRAVATPINAAALADDALRIPDATYRVHSQFDRLLQRTAPRPERNSPRDLRAIAAVSNKAVSPPPNFKERVGLMRHPKRVHGEPSARFTDDWQEAALDIARAWRHEKEDRKAEAESTLALMGMHALEWERKHPKQVAGQALMPGASKKEIEEQQFRLFLRAVGEPDPERFIKSTYLSGSGGRHRQAATFWATVSGLLRAGGVIAPDPAIKTGLSTAALITQGMTAQQLNESGTGRARQSNLERFMPTASAEPPPSSREVASIMRNGASVLRHLHFGGKEKAKLRDALTRVERAQAWEKHTRRIDTEQGRTNHGLAKAELFEAEMQAELLMAKFCFRKQVKDDMKTALENGKVDWRGNQRNMLFSYAGNGAVLSTGLATILTAVPIDAALLGGLSAGAVGAAAALYLYNQLSENPSKDGAAKVRRIIIAWAKAQDSFVDARMPFQKERAEAIRTYRKNKGSAWMTPAQRKAAKLKARAELATTLKTLRQRTLAELDGDIPAEPNHAERENWQAFQELSSHANRLEAEAHELIRQHPERAALIRRELNQGIERLKTACLEAQEHKPDRQVAASNYKGSVQVRLESAYRIARGRAAQAQKHLLGHVADKRLTRPGSTMRESKMRDLEEQMKDALVDLYNMGEFTKRMSVEDPSAADEEAAGRALAAIGNPDIKAVFNGDATRQNDAGFEDMKLTAGAVDRYTQANLGSVMLGIVSTTISNLADIGLNAQRTVEQAHLKVDPDYVGPLAGYQFNDHKVINFSQAGATWAAHLNAGFRQGMQKRVLGPQRRTVGKKEEEPIGFVEVYLNRLRNQEVLERRDRRGRINVALEDVLNQAVEDLKFRTEGYVPEFFRFCRGTDLSESRDEPMMETSGYTRVRYKNADWHRQTGFKAKTVSSIANHTAMSGLGLPLHAAAKLPLWWTRPHMNEATELAPLLDHALLQASATTSAPPTLAAAG